MRIDEYGKCVYTGRWRGTYKQSILLPPQVNPNQSRIQDLLTSYQFFLFIYDVFRSLSFLSERVDGINFSLRYMLSGMKIRVFATIILTDNYFSALNPQSEV
jgi:hypothetical protein